MTMDQNNKGLKLTHYSKQQGLKKLSPSFMRTGVDAGKRANQNLEHDITYFYQEGAEPEPFVTNQSRSKYTVHLPPEKKVYNPKVDGVEHIQAVKDANQGVFNMNHMIQRLKDHGYSGMHIDVGGSPSVAMFEDVDIHGEEPVGGPMSKSEKYHPKRGDTVYLSHGVTDTKRGGEKVDTGKKYVVHNESKGGYRQSHWVVPHGEKDTGKGKYHRTDRLHPTSKFEKKEMKIIDLKKSKNVREQKEKAFGRTSQPSAKSPQREKHMEHIKDFARRRYGLEMNPSGGKIDEKTGERRSENPNVGVDKPDWRSGQLEAQANPDAMTHELGHLEIMPKGVGLEQGQKYMDQQYADVQRKHGYMKQKQSQGEVQPMGIEQLLRRRMGLPANRSAVPVKSKDAPARRAVDTGDVVGTRVQTGKTKAGDPKYGDLIRQSRFVSPENKERVDMIDRKELVYDKKRGWVRPDVSTKQGLRENINSLVNMRAREASKDKTRKDANTLMRSEDGEKE